MNSKWIRIIGIAAVVAVVGVMIVSAVAFAQGPANGTPTDQYSNFVDLDGDGVCDTCGADQPMGMQNGNHGAQGAHGGGFANMDGSAVGSQQMMRGKGQQGAHASQGMQGAHGSQGQQGAYSDAFVDADGDGVCDNYGSFLQDQQGQRGQGRNW